MSERTGTCVAPLVFIHNGYMAFRIRMVEDSLKTLELMTGVLQSLGIEVLPLYDSEIATQAIVMRFMRECYAECSPNNLR